MFFNLKFYDKEVFTFLGFKSCKNIRFYRREGAKKVKLEINSEPEILFFNEGRAVLFVDVNKDIPSVIESLNKGFYTFHFYYPIPKRFEDDQFFVYTEDKKSIDISENFPGYKSISSLILHKDEVNKQCSDSRLSGDIFGILRDRFNYYHKDFDWNIDGKDVLLIISNIDEAEFRNHDIKISDFVYDTTIYSFLKEGKIFIYYPITKDNLYDETNIVVYDFETNKVVGYGLNGVEVEKKV